MPYPYQASDFTGTFWTITDGHYYVSTLGNDQSGDGSPQNPFLTIYRVFEEGGLNSGDKIVIGPNEFVLYEGLQMEGGGVGITCRVASKTDIMSLSGLKTIDGVTIEDGDRVLVWNQAGAAQNGIYVASSGAWQRDESFDGVDNILPGLLFTVTEGDINGASIFQFLQPVDDNGVRVTNISVGSTKLKFENKTRKATPKGLLDCSSNPDYPAGNLGDYYYVSVAGKIGGPSGLDVSVGARIECTAATSAGGDEATVGSEWVVQSFAVTAENGLVVNQGTVELGGTLIQNTQVDTDSNLLLLGKGQLGVENSYGFGVYGTALGGQVLTGVGYFQNTGEFSGMITRGNNPSDYQDTSAELYWGGASISNDHARFAVGQETGNPKFGIYSRISGDNTGLESTASGIRIEDSQASAGAFYGADYSANFVDRSLVDKAYVDTAITNAGGGDVTKVGTPANNQVAVWTGDGTVEGDQNLTFNSGILSIGTYTRVGTNGYRTAQMNSSGSLNVYGEVAVGQDSGSSPVIRLDANLNSAGAINTRPLLSLENFNTVVTEVKADGSWDFQSNLLTNLADPVSAQDAATKAYVDANAGINLGDFSFDIGTSDALSLESNTSDGNDTKVLFLSGGGSPGYARGANIKLRGNEHSFLGGSMDLETGNSAPIRFVSGGNILTELESSGSWDFKSNLLTNLADPVNDQDAATKAYVDQIENSKYSGSDNSLTISNVSSGLSSVTLNSFFFTRMDDIVTFSCKLSINPTSAGSQTFNINLPISSAFTNSLDACASGIASNSDISLVRAFADGTNDNLIVVLDSSASSGIRDVFLSGHYVIK